MIRLTVESEIVYRSTNYDIDDLKDYTLDDFGGTAPDMSKFLPNIRFVIILDGKKVALTPGDYRNFSEYSDSEGKVTHSIHCQKSSNEVWQYIKDVRFDEIDESIVSIHFVDLIDYDDTGIEADLLREGEIWSVSVFQFRFHKYSWKKLWSIFQFVETFNSSMKENFISGNQEQKYRNKSRIRGAETHIVFPISNQSSTLLQEWSLRSGEVRLLLDETERRLRSTLSEDSLVLQFDVPEEIRTSCEQYLLYFVQFLKDVGIKADAQIQHENGDAGQVLFSVTPADGKQALEKVRQALDAYLRVSRAPNMAPDFSASIEVQRLQSQLFHFQGQLMLARAEIQHKDATIELKNALLERLNSGTVFVQTTQTLSTETKPDTTTQLNSMVAREIRGADLEQFLELTRQWVAQENPPLALGEYINSCLLGEASKPPLPLASSKT